MYILRITWIILLILPGLMGSAQDTQENKASGPEVLIGTWKIDLRPGPEAEAYFQEFKVEEIANNTFTGSFYGSPLQDAYINTEWTVLYFAFTTNDATHAYYHSAFLKEGTLYGTTYCPGRAFIARWTGERKPTSE